MSLWVCPKCEKFYGGDTHVCPDDGTALEYATFVVTEPIKSAVMTVSGEAGMSPDRWQPMETAPKDDTRILVFLRIDGKNCWPQRDTSVPAIDITSWWNGDELNQPRWRTMLGEPLCWMPLPEFPAEGA